MFVLLLFLLLLWLQTMPVHCVALRNQPYHRLPFWSIHLDTINVTSFDSYSPQCKPSGPAAYCRHPPATANNLAAMLWGGQWYICMHANLPARIKQ